MSQKQSIRPINNFEYQDGLGNRTSNYQEMDTALGYYGSDYYWFDYDKYTQEH